MLPVRAQRCIGSSALSNLKPRPEIILLLVQPVLPTTLLTDDFRLGHSSEVYRVRIWAEVRSAYTHVKDTANGICETQGAGNCATISKKQGLAFTRDLRQSAVAEALVAIKVAGISARA